MHQCHQLSEPYCGIVSLCPPHGVSGLGGPLKAIRSSAPHFPETAQWSLGMEETLQGAQGVKHGHERTLPPLPSPHAGAVNILSTFPDLRFITIPLFTSTSNEFHSERTTLLGFCHLTFWQLEFLCMSSSLLTSTCLWFCQKKKKKKKGFPSGLGWASGNGVMREAVLLFQIRRD